jgi:prepilin-type N-terminal cleavage/methylation domain-containing protein
VKRSGFTLIEVICSITIILVIAALSFPLLTPSILAAKRTKAVSQLHQLGLAMTLYRSEWDGDGAYGPASKMGLPANWLVSPPIDGYAKHVRGTDGLWWSPCFPHPKKQHPTSASYKTSYLYYFTDDPAEYWPKYSVSRQEQSILFVDDECVDPDVDPNSGFMLKQLYAVELSGQLRKQQRRNRLALFEWDQQEGK